MMYGIDDGLISQFIVVEADEGFRKVCQEIGGRDSLIGCENID